MSKNAKILITLICLALLLVIYLIFSSKAIKIESQNGNIKDFSIASQINLEKLEEEYKNLAREIIAELENYYNDFNEQDITTATSADALLAATSSEHNVAENDNSEIIIAASNLRERLIELKVPKNYKELHLKIALSIDKLEAYCGSSDSSDRLDGLEILEQIRLDYSWL